MSEYAKKLRPRVSTGVKRSLSSRSNRLTLKVYKNKKKKLVRKRTRPNKTDEVEIDPIMAEPSSAFDVSVTDKPAGNVKKYKPRKKSKSEVHRLLQKAGVDDPEAVCLCLKAGISSGCVNFEIPAPLDQIILQSKCYTCENDVAVKVSDVLYQGPMGGAYWDGFDNDVICPNKECNERFVVSDICTPHPELQDGKFYNHCELCPGFGKCIGDFRHSHCMSCGDHYFAGSMGQFKCANCYSTDDEDDDMNGFGSFNSSKPPRDDMHIFSYIYKKLEILRFDALRCDPDLIESEVLFINDESSSDTDFDCCDPIT